MPKRIMFLAALFTLTLTALYAQIVPPLGFDINRRLPAPPDPVEDKVLILSQDDTACQEKAQEYIKESKYDLAIAELEKISNQWASHWFLSYLYEFESDYQKALTEISWLISNNERKDLILELTAREKSIETTIKNAEDWEERWDSPQRKNKALIWE